MRIYIYIYINSLSVGYQTSHKLLIFIRKYTIFILFNGNPYMFIKPEKLLLLTDSQEEIQ